MERRASTRRRTAHGLGALGFTLCALLATATAAHAACGDGVLDAGEACDDGGVVAGDGCDAGCGYEPHCLVTQASDAQLAFVVRVDADGGLEAITAAPLGGSASTSPKGTTRCGRFVYFARDGFRVEGYAVALDGTLLPLNGANAGYLSELDCDAEADLLFAWSGTTGPPETASFQVGGNGSLTYVTQTAPPFCEAEPGDRHPITGDVFTACRIGAGAGGSGSEWQLRPVSSDAAGNLTLGTARGYIPDELPGSSDLAFTRDGGFLVVPQFSFGVLFGSGFTHCFGWFPGPVLEAPASGPELQCTAPFGGFTSTSYQAFVPRPEGGPLFYHQAAGLLQSGELTAAGPVSRFQITPSHDSEQLLTAFDGQLLVSLGTGSIASYGVAPDRVTLSPVQKLPLGTATYESGVLLPCPGLSDTDGDGVADPEDNCLAVPNADQRDANAGSDDDASQPGVQHYGDACDADLDDDGVVAASDFFGVLRPCLGAMLATRPECSPSDLDGDGAVGAADFFGHLRPALGTRPGPGVTD